MSPKKRGRWVKPCFQVGICSGEVAVSDKGRVLGFEEGGISPQKEIILNLSNIVIGWEKYRQFFDGGGREEQMRSAAWLGSEV